jgi:hypothetical protein
MAVMIAVLCVNRVARADEEIKDTTEYIFTDENVMGELVGIEGVSIQVRPRGADRSLIKVRVHFVNEILKSVETM